MVQVARKLPPILPNMSQECLNQTISNKT